MYYLKPKIFYTSLGNVTGALNIYFLTVSCGKFVGNVVERLTITFISFFTVELNSTLKILLLLYHFKYKNYMKLASSSFVGSVHSWCRTLLPSIWMISMNTLFWHLSTRIGSNSDVNGPMLIERIALFYWVRHLTDWEWLNIVPCLLIALLLYPNLNRNRNVGVCISMRGSGGWLTI